MAVPTNTVQTFSRVANREDLTDKIYNIEPTKTPFMTSIGRGKATNITHDWQTDDLKAADGDNKHLQGDDTTIETAPATTRLQNETQIMKKSVSVSGTQEAINHAGIASMTAYQMAQRMKELKRDMEKRLTGNYAAVAGGAATAGELASFEAWVRDTTSNRGTGGAQGTLTDAGGISRLTAAATDGTQRAFTETMLKDVMQKAVTAGGEPTILSLGAAQKQVVSGFAGIADQRRETGNKKATIVGAADVYVSDFGELTFTLNLFQRNRSALFIDPEHAKLCYLRPIKSEELSRTGDNMKADITTEFTLEMCNPEAHGVAADLS